MSTQNISEPAIADEGATAPNAAAREASALPRPPMLWLLVPVVLLALLAFLSRG